MAAPESALGETASQRPAPAKDLRAMAHFRRWIADALTPELRE